MIIFNNILFLLMLLPTLYNLIYTIASYCPEGRKRRKKDNKRNYFLVVIPSYAEDKVIELSAKEILHQNYPRENYEVLIISDNMQKTTDEKLRNHGAKVLNVVFKNSTKGKAINFALQEYDFNSFDYIVVLDADNIVTSSFLTELNDEFNTGVKIIQTHRTAKNTNTPIALLDAVSEEMHNTIQRKGHVRLGLSSQLIGSGMAFEFNWFKSHWSKINTSVEDKEINIIALEEKVYISYLDKTIVLDEKVSDIKAFKQQRKRWQSGALYFFNELKAVPKALCTCNISLIDSIIQRAMPPVIVVLGIIVLMSLLNLIYEPLLAIKWITLLLATILTLWFAIPQKLRGWRLIKAFILLPSIFSTFIVNYLNLDKLTHFNHTRHG